MLSIRQSLETLRGSLAHGTQRSATQAVPAPKKMQGEMKPDLATLTRSESTPDLRRFIDQSFFEDAIHN